MVTVFIAVISVEKIFAQDSASNAASAVTAAANSCESPEGARHCAANKGYDAEAAQIGKSAQNILTQAQTASGQGAIIPEMSQIIQMSEAASAYASKYSFCVNTQNIASTVCVEKTSPHLQEGLNTVNALLAGVGSMAVKDKCSMMAKAMNIAQGVLTAYTATCSAARATCEASCSFVKKKLETVMSLNKKFGCIPPVTNMAEGCTAFDNAVNVDGQKISDNASKDLSESDVKSTAVKDKACTYSYAGMLASAGAGIFSIIKTLGEANNCDEKTKGDTSEQKTAQLAVSGEVCDDAKNANLPECICKKNPRTPGCTNALQKVGENSANRLAAGGLGAGGSSSKSNGGSGFDGSPGTPPIEHREINDAGGGGLPGAPTGGGSAGLGSGGSGGGGSAGGTGDAEGSGLDLDKYGSGYGGGGGGGGKYGAGLAGSNSGKYRAYLPGGAKDPRRGLAGQQAWTKEVTGQGGKSNWEKVKERYHDNKSTLLNN